MNAVAKRSDISDAEALRACWGWGEPRGEGAMDKLSATWPRKVAEAKLHHLSRRHLIDYGVSINYPWRTEAGEQLLRELESREMLVL